MHLEAVPTWAAKLERINWYALTTKPAKAMSLTEISGLLDGIQDDPQALRELASHWGLGAAFNDADKLWEYAQQCERPVELTKPASWVDGQPPTTATGIEVREHSLLDADGVQS